MRPSKAKYRPHHSIFGSILGLKAEHRPLQALEIAKQREAELVAEVERLQKDRGLWHGLGVRGRCIHIYIYMV